jgi:hypothetical protein
MTSLKLFDLPVVVTGCNDRLTVAFSNPLGKLNTAGAQTETRQKKNKGKKNNSQY